MALAPSSAIAFNGLCVGISAALLLSFLSQSAPDAIDVAQAAQLDPAVQVIPPALATFFTGVTFSYVHLRNGGRGIPEVMFFILCASIGLLDLSLFLQPGPVQAPLLGAAALQVLQPAAVATFFLAIMMLIYAHGHTAGAANPAAVELLNQMTLAATLVTAVLSLIAVVLTFNTK